MNRRFRQDTLPQPARPRTDKRLYAAYGSNLHPVRLQDRLPTAELVGVAELAGFELCFNKRSNVDGSGKCNIQPAESATHVAVYELEAGDQRRLDAIEGVGNGYRVELVRLDGFGDCFVYVAESAHVDDDLMPFSWYKKLVLAGCRYHAFPAGYHERIARWRCRPDPDRRRHSAGMALVTRARRRARPRSR